MANDIIVLGLMGFTTSSSPSPSLISVVLKVSGGAATCFSLFLSLIWVSVKDGKGPTDSAVSRRLGTGIKLGRARPDGGDVAGDKSGNTRDGLRLIELMVARRVGGEVGSEPILMS